MLTRALLLMLAFMLPGTVMAINCAKAKSNDEKTICTHPQLQQLDTVLNRINISNKYYTDEETVEADQEAWLNKRKQCENDVICLSNSYVSRIKKLATLDRNFANISVMHKASKRFDFFVIASSTALSITSHAYGPAIVYIFLKNKNKLVQEMRIKKTFLKGYQDIDKDKVNVLEEREANSLNPLSLDDFDIRDLNFNGFEDLVLSDTDEGGYGSFTYAIFLYHPESQKFIKSKEFSEKLGHTNTSYLGMDKKAKTLTTAFKDGCCFHQYETWQVQKNKLVLVKEVMEGDDSILADYEGRSNYNHDIDVTKTRELIHGKWKTTITKKKRPVIDNPSVPPAELKEKPKKYDIHDHLRIFYLSHMYRDYILRVKQINSKLNFDSNFLDLFRFASKESD